MKCPNCGGTLYFDIRSQKLKCQSCDTTMEVREYKEDNAAKENIIEGARMYTCRNCGAKLISANSEAVSYCNYCGSEAILESEMKGVKRPKYIMPFRIDKQECKQIYEKELSGRLYVPKEFKDPEFIERFRPFYIPYWMYNIGFRKDPFTVEGHRTYTQGSDTIDETYEVTVQLDANVLGVPQDASRNFDDAIAEDIAPFSRKYLYNYYPGYMAGMYADAPNVEPELYKEEVIAKAAKEAEDKLRSGVSGISLDLPSRRKDLETLLDAHYISEETIYLPVWFLTWRKNDRVAYAVVNGESGKIHIDLPADIGRFVRYTLAAAAVLFMLLTIFVSVTSRFVLWFAALLVYLVGIRYHKELKQIRNRENHVFDKGYLLSDDEKLPMSEKKRSKARRKARRDDGSVGMLVRTSIMFLVFALFGLTGELYDVMVSQTGALALTSIVVVLETVRFFKQLSVARYLKNKRSVFISILGLCAVWYAEIVAYTMPVKDWWYYLGGLICLLAAGLMSVDLIARYNETSTRPLPSFYERTGGNDRA